MFRISRPTLPVAPTTATRYPIVRQLSSARAKRREVGVRPKIVNAPGRLIAELK
jgi:hypothetical protein